VQVAILGLKSADIIRGIVKDSFDSVNIYKFERVDRFIEEVSIRSTFYDRLLLMQDSVMLLDDRVREHSLIEFCNFISGRFPEMRVVTLSKDMTCAKMLAGIFFSPIHINLNATSMKVGMIDDIISNTIDDLKRKYGGVTADLESMMQQEVIDSSPPPQETFESPFGQQTIGKPGIGAKSSKKDQKEKKGFFGRKKGKPEPEQQQSVPTYGDFQTVDNFGDDAPPLPMDLEDSGPPILPNMDTDDDLFIPSFMDDELSRDFNTTSNFEEDDELPPDFEDVASDIDHGMEEGVLEGDVFYKEDTESSLREGHSFESTFASDGFVEQTESEEDDGLFSDVEDEDAPPLPFDDIDDGMPEIPDFQEDEESESEFDFSAFADEQEEEPPEFEDIIEEEPPETSIVEIEEEDFELGDSDFETPEEEVETGVSIDEDEESEIPDLPEDTTVKESIEERQARLRNLTQSAVIEDVVAPIEPIVKPVETRQLDTEDVEESDDGIDVWDMAGDYESELAPKPETRVVERVVEKIIEKPVVEERVIEKIVHVSGKSDNQLVSISKGEEQGYFVVTGDRRSGVTTTAINVAKFFSKKVNTLFVDFDFVRRGSLMYFGLDDLINYDDHQSNSLGLISHTRMLKQMAITTSLGFDCLISLYGNALPSDRYQIVQDVLLTQKEYGVVVFDVPIEVLPKMESTLVRSKLLLNVEANITSVMNTFLHLSSMKENSRYTSLVYDKSRVILTKYQDDKIYSKLISVVEELFDVEDDQVDWTRMPYVGGANNVTTMLENLFKLR
jgi:cellulose biosynthesis protein BcsQ